VADDITLNAGTGGPKVRGLDDGTREWPVGISAYPTGGSSGSYTFQIIDLTHGLPSQNVPGASGGLSAYRNLDLGTTGQVVKNAAGQLYGYYLYNGAAAARFVKVYNKSTAPTGSDTPVLTIPLPAGAAANVFVPQGIAFGAGISARASTGIADADTGAPSANDVVVNLLYA
jgi:hypothetical protein